MSFSDLHNWNIRSINEFGHSEYNLQIGTLTQVAHWHQKDQVKESFDPDDDNHLFQVIPHSLFVFFGIPTSIIPFLSIVSNICLFQTMYQLFKQIEVIYKIFAQIVFGNEVHENVET